MRTESRERGPALLTCTDEEGGTSCRRKNLGDDLFHREKPSRSLSSFFCSRARPSGDSVWAYMVVKFPISTVQPNNTVAGEVWQRNNFLSLVVRWKVTCPLALVPFARARAIAGTPVTAYMSERPTSGFVGRSYMYERRLQHRYYTLGSLATPSHVGVATLVTLHKGLQE